MWRFFLIVSFIICSLVIVIPAFSQSLTGLLAAIKNNDSIQLASLLNKGADISVADEDGDNALMYAALYSTAGCMELLLKKGARPDAKNKLEETAIMWCSHDVEKTKLLLRYKAGLNYKTTDGNTPLLVACIGREQNEMVRLLLDNGADPLLVNNKKNTSLMRVAIYGDTSTARLLLNKGVDINAQSSDSESALFFAIRSSNKEMVHWLIANGAEVNVKDSYKATPLSYAVILNDIKMVTALLEKTTGINEQDIDGMTILMWAIYSEYDNPDIVQALLDKGASLELKDKWGNTALGWALKKGNTPTVALLKKAAVR